MVKRVEEILTNKEISINNDCIIMWKKINNRLKKGSDYLSPEIDIIADDALDNNAKLRLLNFLNKWLVEYTNNVWEI